MLVLTVNNSTKKYLLSCTLLPLLLVSAESGTLRMLEGPKLDLDKYEYTSYYIHYTYEKIYRCIACDITPTWTLTSGHCINGFITKQWHTRRNLGNVLSFIMMEAIRKTKLILKDFVYNYHATSTQITYVLEVVKFPSKRDIYLTLEDILLLRTEPKHLYTYGKLSAVNFSALSGQEAIMVGYNLLESRTPQKEFTWTLTARPVKVLMKSCDSDKHAVFPTLCTVHLCGAFSSLCNGMGGLLIHASGIVGIPSRIDKTLCMRGNDSYGSRNAGYFTPVSVFIDWIHLVTEGDDIVNEGDDKVSVM